MEIEVNRDLIYIGETKCRIWLHKALHEVLQMRIMWAGADRIVGNA